VKSYEGTESTGKVQISGCDVSKLSGKHVLFVEDIIDTGLTMSRYHEINYSWINFIKPVIFKAFLNIFMKAFNLHRSGELLKVHSSSTTIMFNFFYVELYR
jgi:phosphoribosylpyrophosphate synthetase